MVDLPTVLDSQNLAILSRDLTFHLSHQFSKRYVTRLLASYFSRLKYCSSGDVIVLSNLIWLFTSLWSDASQHSCTWLFFLNKTLLNYIPRQYSLLFRLIFILQYRFHQQNINIMFITTFWKSCCIILFGLASNSHDNRNAFPSFITITRGFLDFEFLILPYRIPLSELIISLYKHYLTSPHHCLMVHSKRKLFHSSQQHWTITQRQSHIEICRKY
jgi:hypothetical protein